MLLGFLRRSHSILKGLFSRVKHPCLAEPRAMPPKVLTQTSIKLEIDVENGPFAIEYPLIFPRG